MEKSINDINSIVHSTAKFEVEFCKKKFYSSSKCKSFYLNNLNAIVEEINVCPYGYACIFGKSKIISSLIDDKHSNLTMLRNRAKYNNKCSKNATKITILSSEEIKQLLLSLKKEDIYNEYRDTFHDLSNNNRYLKDIIDKLELNEKIKNHKNIKNLIDNLMNIFETHNNKLKECADIDSKRALYIEEINKIDTIKNMLLKIDYVISILDFKDNLRFIDYRIRYLKRITEGNGNLHQDKFLKDLNIHSMITKLRYSFKATLAKKQQDLKIHSPENLLRIFKGYDDVYLGLFILLENSIKYAPLNSIIDIYISNNTDNKINIEISNISDYIDDINYLRYRGVVGRNHKEGNGLGLNIASQIFEASDIEFKFEFKENKFYYYLCISIL